MYNMWRERERERECCFMIVFVSHKLYNPFPLVLHRKMITKESVSINKKESMNLEGIC